MSSQPCQCDNTAITVFIHYCGWLYHNHTQSITLTYYRTHNWYSVVSFMHLRVPIVLNLLSATDPPLNSGMAVTVVCCLCPS